jgi:DNA integrity scanning protein DisA with diadenylate cyclase activity
MCESERNYARAIIESAGVVAKQVKAKAVIARYDAIPDFARLLELIPNKIRVIIFGGVDIAEKLEDKRIVRLDVPSFQLTRMDQIKMATVLALSQRVLDAGDTFVALTGVADKSIDTLVVMEVGKEYELFDSVGQPKLTEHVRRVVFQRVLTMALELANEGREGKPIGALFVIGNMRELQKYSEQNIINPFRGYAEKDRNILDDRLRNTVKEFAAIDGAFIIKGNGVIVSAGTTLRPDASGVELPQGLGARHGSAAAISASTKSIAITVSESTGTVRLWRLGTMVIEIEKAPRAPAPPRNAAPFD